MSHECPPTVRSKLRDQRVRKHARRIWSVGEAVRIVSGKCRPDRPERDRLAPTERTVFVRYSGELSRKIECKHNLNWTRQQMEHKDTYHRQALWPVQLQKAWSNMLLWPEFEHQASGCVLHSLQWCDRCLRHVLYIQSFNIWKITLVIS